jgi:hypothetical protein
MRDEFEAKPFAGIGGVAGEFATPTAPQPTIETPMRFTPPPPDWDLERREREAREREEKEREARATLGLDDSPERKRGRGLRRSGGMLA